MHNYMKKLEAKKRETGESPEFIRTEEKYVPAVVYGKGEENILVKVPDNVFRSLYRDIRDGAEFTLSVEGDKDYTVVLKDMQVHPTTGFLIHIDFLVAGE